MIIFLFSYDLYVEITFLILFCIYFSKYFPRRHPAGQVLVSASDWYMNDTKFITNFCIYYKTNRSKTGSYSFYS